MVCGYQAPDPPGPLGMVSITPSRVLSGLVARDTLLMPCCVHADNALKR